MQTSETKVSEGQKVELSVVLNSYLIQSFSHYMYMRKESSMAISYHKYPNPNPKLKKVATTRCSPNNEQLDCNFFLFLS